jgi:predicted ribosomally synthesized peptide with nif11-like leader
MSKTIAEVYEEVMKSAELQKEFLAAEQSGAIAAFAKAQGCEASAEEVQAFLKTKLSEDKELSLDELDQVAGGKGDNQNNNIDNEINIQIDGNNNNITNQP